MTQVEIRQPSSTVRFASRRLCTSAQGYDFIHSSTIPAVPAFDPKQWNENQVDWYLLQNGYVTKFWSTQVLGETVSWLRQAKYEIVEMDTSKWLSELDAHRDFAVAFSFPDYYGNNLSALADCLDDVALYSYGADQEATGTVLILGNYDRFSQRDGGLAEALLDIFAGSARRALLVGHRMMCLVQSNNPMIEFSPVGATPVVWNSKEFLDSKRRP